MRRIFPVIVFVVLNTIASSAQVGDQPKTPREIVDRFWKMATEGELLTDDGWRRVSGMFAKQLPFPGNDVILIVSNSW